MRERQVCPL